jgi:hypothetical protein
MILIDYLQTVYSAISMRKNPKFIYVQDIGYDLNISMKVQ